MSATNDNARLETFCDGVFAIAITLLILEIKVPHVESIHSVADLWRALGHLWPSFFAFSLSFLIILIAWVNHHGLFKLLDKSSPRFMFANGFFLVTLVVLPFTSALMAEYIETDYAQPAIVLYCFSSLFNNIGWNVLFESTLNPKLLATNAEHKIKLVEGRKNARYGFCIYLLLTIFAWWFPYTALVINTVLWFVWLYVGVIDKKKDSEHAA